MYTTLLQTIYYIKIVTAIQQQCQVLAQNQDLLLIRSALVKCKSLNNLVLLCKENRYPIVCLVVSGGWDGQSMFSCCILQEKNQNMCERYVSHSPSGVSVSYPEYMCLIRSTCILSGVPVSYPDYFCILSTFLS